VLTRSDLVRRALAGGTALSLGGLAGLADEAWAATPKPTRGGQLRVGAVGGGSKESLDPNVGFNESDVMRHRALFEGLVEFGKKGRIVNQLAREIAPNGDASVWTIRLRPGVVFHDGKPFTADDVIYSLKYMLDPTNKSASLTLLQPVLDPSGIERVDSGTVRLRLKQSNSLLPQVLAERTMKMFPSGATGRALDSNPVGTGPFKFQSWTRGERSLFVRNGNWSARGAFGPAYVNELLVLSITEATSRFNALLGGQLDIAADVGASLGRVAQRNSRLRVLSTPSASFTAFYMALNAAPFNDVRVRQAFRLMIDRPQIIKSVLAGRGKLGNDLSSWFDPNYASDLPQRPHDPEKAKALLKRAGRAGLHLSLATSDAAQAMLESATLFKEQAKTAGVRIDLQKVASDQYYNVYPRTPWGQTNWGGRPFASMVSYAFLEGASFNETHWVRPKFTKLFLTALRTSNAAKRKALLVDAQHLLWDDGGYIIWGFPNTIDAMTKKVKGLVGSPLRPCNFYDVSSVYLLK